MEEENLVTENHEWVKDFFESLEQMSNKIENLTVNYRPTLDGEHFLTDKEISEKLKISRRTLQEYRTNGVIPYIQLGGKVLYRESDIQKLLDENYQAGFRK